MLAYDNNDVLLQLPECTIRHSNGEWLAKIPSFTIRKGSVTLLKGENMSGKSTLLRVLANQQVTVPLSLQSRLHSVSTILSSADDPMFCGWSIRDNVFVCLKNFSRNNASLRLKVYLDRVNKSCNWNISDCDLLFNYSTGVRAFIQLARAFVAQPALYLIDEITPNLDDEKLHLFFDVLSDLRINGTALIMVSHSPRDQSEFIKCFKNLIVMQFMPASGRVGSELSCIGE